MPFLHVQRRPRPVFPVRHRFAQDTNMQCLCCPGLQNHGTTIRYGKVWLVFQVCVFA